MCLLDLNEKNIISEYYSEKNYYATSRVGDTKEISKNYLCRYKIYGNASSLSSNNSLYS